MRFMIRLIVLGFAGLGMYKAWEMLEPKVSEARDRAAGARDRIEPAIRDAADTLQSATKDAADTLQSATKDATDTLTEGMKGIDDVAPDAFGTAAEKVSPTPKLST